MYYFCSELQCKVIISWSECRRMRTMTWWSTRSGDQHPAAPVRAGLWQHPRAAAGEDPGGEGDHLRGVQGLLHVPEQPGRLPDRYADVHTRWQTHITGKLFIGKATEIFIAKYFTKYFPGGVFPRCPHLHWQNFRSSHGANRYGWRVRKRNIKWKKLLYFSVPNLRRGWRRSAELPGVHRDDEGPHPPRAEELQQAGGLGGVQAVHQARDERGLLIRIVTSHQPTLSVVIHSSQNIPVTILMKISLNCYLIFRYISFWSELQLNCLIYLRKYKSHRPYHWSSFLKYS